MRLALVLLARCFAWRETLTIVQLATLVRWHRQAFHLLWRWRSQPGRPRLPAEFQQLIAATARDNLTWGEERIAAELLLKLGLRVSPRTVRRYMARGNGGGGHRATGHSILVVPRNVGRDGVASAEEDCGSPARVAVTTRVPLED
jgi:hypothetical protein